MGFERIKGLVFTAASAAPRREAPAEAAADAALVAELARARQELESATDRLEDLGRAHNELGLKVARLTELSQTDVLPGLGNRRRFEESLAASFALAVRQDWPLSLIMLDVDSFKSYNDTYGHAAGDLALSVVGTQLAGSCRSYDVLARYGGEEFAVLLPTANEAQALEVAERQREAIAAYPWPLRPVTVSCGVATVWPSSGGLESLVEEADRALYHSKRAGRNRSTHINELHPSR